MYIMQGKLKDGVSVGGASRYAVWVSWFMAKNSLVKFGD